jgi:hypothetical protein
VVKEVVEKQEDQVKQEKTKEKAPGVPEENIKNENLLKETTHLSKNKHIY